MSVTQSKAIKHYEKMYCDGSIYVWGFNSGTIINETTINKAYNAFKSTQYNKAYYDKKLIEGKGKNGSDCSGAHYPISGYDTTARMYYQKCTKKGSISTLPKNKVVLLFKESNGNIGHTGVYLGNGMCFHMKNSASNAIYESVLKHKWTYWGYADFISDYSKNVSAKFDATSWVSLLQASLNKYGYKDVNGNLLEVDGKIGKLTMSALPVLKKNSSNTIVMHLQLFLNLNGYNCGEPDGAFGNNTMNALKKFQKDNSIKDNGICDAATWGVIKTLTA